MNTLTYLSRRQNGEKLFHSRDEKEKWKRFHFIRNRYWKLFHTYSSFCYSYSWFLFHKAGDVYCLDSKCKKCNKHQAGEKCRDLRCEKCY